jgi:hypothetical protein
MGLNVQVPPPPPFLLAPSPAPSSPCPSLTGFNAPTLVHPPAPRPAPSCRRYMVATVKHSGSLVTLSGEQGFASKNSLDNAFTSGRGITRVIF